MKTARWVAAVVLLLIVAGCTGVPTSSGPQVVRTIGLGELPAASPPAPPQGATRSDIVQGFIDAIAASPDQLDAARAYLDPAAAQRWTVNPVSVVRDLRVGVENQTDGSVPVTGVPVGSLTANGQYSPALKTTAAASVTLATYALAKNAAGQWRITSPVPSGIYISDVGFARSFTPKPLYFPDLAGDRLVPDLRYSALSGQSLESFLLTQLVAGPRDELQNAVTAFAPQPTGTQRVSVTRGSPTVVQVPGASGLDGPGRTRLAAQLAFTLRTTSFLSELEIRDGTRVVDVPGVADPFDFTDFADLATVDESAPTTLTYVRGGAVIDATGKAFPGPLGSGTYALDNAVFDGDGGRTLVAGTTGPAGPRGARSLLVGGTTGLAPVAGLPRGPLTAPAWAPVGTSADSDEVWVASGAQLYRAVPGAKATPVQAATSTGAQLGTIVSISFSPEGSRVALVIASGATAQVWVGSVVRTGLNAGIDQLKPITPADIVVSDVGWRTETLLAAVGTAPGYSSGGVYLDVAVDGSRLAPASPDVLPNPPRTIAVSPRSTAQWVTVGTGSDSNVWSRTSSTGSWAGTSREGASPSFSI